VCRRKTELAHLHLVVHLMILDEVVLLPRDPAKLWQTPLALLGGTLELRATRSIGGGPTTIAGRKIG
jgi:hypothetical protein